eukprot:m.240105 g.240105  ORF g.240105 m.240105 type:complete len:54 (-) comp15299_c0_seq11:2899-3060(-)
MDQPQTPIVQIITRTSREQTYVNSHSLTHCIIEYCVDTQTANKGAAGDNDFCT